MLKVIWASMRQLTIAMWIWLLLSFAILIWGSAESFQRLGSLGVATTIIGIGWALRRADELEGRLQSNFRGQTSRGLEALMKVSSTISRILKSDKVEEEIKADLTELSSLLAEVAEDQKKNSQVDDETSRDLSFLKGQFLRNEVLLLSLGTLQWGYGDLFHTGVRNVLF
ncbi:hypothetical protein [Ruegeria jejuensis]|uniref:hypothetical protein n=1 Tax=Ruegeria jejuensis TaxID=3233338 RepID=UPI00355BCB2B